MAGQPIAAQEESDPSLEWPRERINHNIFLAPQRPNQDVTVLVGQRLFFRQLADLDQTGDQGMIVRELPQFPFSSR